MAQNIVAVVLFLIVLCAGIWCWWLENGKTLSMHDIEEISWRYAREVEHSDDNLNALEDWLFETYAPEGCVLEEE